MLCGVRTCKGKAGGGEGEEGRERSGGGGVEGEEGRRVGLDMKVGGESERVQDVLMIKNAISKVSGF